MKAKLVKEVEKLIVEMKSIELESARKIEKKFKRKISTIEKISLKGTK